MGGMRLVDKIRYALNILFLIGAAVTLFVFIIYGNGEVFRYTGFATLTIKVFEFILRFVN